MDETYVKVKGQWVYLHSAVDKLGDNIDFMLFEQRDEMAATTFFKQVINNNEFPHKVVMDKSGASYAGIENSNRLMILAGLINLIQIIGLLKRSPNR
jgi:putative transposase